MGDEIIIQKIKSKEEQGFIMLMERYCSYVAAIICNLSRGLLRVEDVEELSADVFIAVYNNGSRLREGGTLKPYVAQIARNATLSRLRKRKLEPIPLDENILVVSNEDNPDELTVKREQTEIINDAVESFTEPDREIFIRFYFFGEQVKTIAQRMSMNPATIKTRLHRCRKKLKSILEERGYRSENKN